MFLFLDVISPIPEFFIIEDNKVIINRKILNNSSCKLSDNIFETYKKIDNDINLTQKLEKIAITVGPGSYTSLRVGAAFISGLKISRKLFFYPLAIDDIFKFKMENNFTEDFAFYICSAQNQNFFCTKKDNNKIEYIKIDNDKININTGVNKIFFNQKELRLSNKNIKQYKFSFINEIIQNNNKLNFTKDLIIKPIYISNNKILN